MTQQVGPSGNVLMMGDQEVLDTSSLMTAELTAELSDIEVGQDGKVPKEASLLNLKELPRTGKRGAPQAFPHLLFLMLERENQEIIRWCQEGRAFVSRRSRIFL